MLELLRDRLIRHTNYGEDGIEIFVPTRPLRLLNFEIVRFAGWQGRDDGGALPPFHRLPGTAPPEHIAVTVRASADEVHQELARRRIKEGRYVAVSSDPSGMSRRLAPGPQVSAGDYEYGVHAKLRGVTTIECSATKYDF